MASDWVGFTFPGMIDEPGSFSGMVSSPSPQRGPEASQRMSLAIFISAAASALSAPLAATVLLMFGLGAFGSIVVLQLLLVTKVLTFEQQIEPVSLAYLALAVWLVGSGILGSRSGTIPRPASRCT